MTTEAAATKPTRKSEEADSRGRAPRFLLVAAAFLAALTAGGAWLWSGLDQTDERRARVLEGTVADVDVAGGTIRVSRGPFGLLVETLEVESGTRIRVVGRPATLTDIRESARVRVGYTVNGGRSVADSVDMVLPPTVAARAGS
jgi:hypothetical protein